MRLTFPGQKPKAVTLPRSAYWAFPLIVLLLLGLLVAPIVVENRIEPLRDGIETVIEPSRDLLREVELALARQMAAIRGYALMGQENFIRRYSEARSLEDRSYARFRELAPQLGPTARRELAHFEEKKKLWDAASWQTIREPSLEELTAQTPSQQHLYEDLLLAASRLHDAIDAEVENQRDQIRGAEEIGILLTVGMVILALAAALLLSWLSRRMRILTRDLARRAREEAEARELFSQLAESIREVFWISDPEYKEVIYVNPAYESIWGRSRESLYRDPKSLLDVVHPEDRERAQAALAEQFPKGEYNLEYRIMRPDGSVRWIWARGFPIRNERGKIDRIVGVADDVTERKRAEQEVEQLLDRERKAHGETEEARQRVTSILESIPDAFMSLDREWKIAYLNREARRLLKVLLQKEADEILDRPFWDAAPQLRGTVFESKYRQAMTERTPLLFEEFFDAFDTWFEVRVYPSEEGISIYFRDVTWRKKDEEERLRLLESERHSRMRLETSEQKTAFLADASEILSSALDYKGTLQRLAQLAVPTIADLCIIDLTQDQHVERVAISHAEPEKEDAYAGLLQRHRPDLTRGPFARILRTRQPELVPEVSAKWLDGFAPTPEYRRAIKELGANSIMLVPLVARENLHGVMTFAMAGRRYNREDLNLASDLARRVALTVDNFRLYELSRQAVRVRDEVLAIVSHDLRNLLNTMSMSALLLQRASLTEKEQRQLTILSRSLRHMSRLIDDLRDVALIEAGQRLTVEPHPVEASLLIDEAYDLFREQIESKSLQFERLVPDDLPPVSADRDRMLQLLSNLLGNAIKFTPEGSSVALRAEKKEDEVEISVADTGPGIKPEDLERIFDPFWQAQKTARLGIGMGLPISKAIVEAHGGRIWVHSQPGRGATFYFTLPLAKTSKVPSPEESSFQPTSHLS